MSCPFLVCNKCQKSRRNRLQVQCMNLKVKDNSAPSCNHEWNQNGLQKCLSHEVILHKNKGSVKRNNCVGVYAGKVKHELYSYLFHIKTLSPDKLLSENSKQQTLSITLLYNPLTTMMCARWHPFVCLINVMDSLAFIYLEALYHWNCILPKKTQEIPLREQITVFF